MKKSVLLIAVLTLAGTGTALAGRKLDWTVFINSSYSYAQGSLGTARNSSDSVEYIGCQFFATSNSSAVTGLCWAHDAAGNNATCFAASAALVEVIEHMPSDGTIRFSWDASGYCTRVDILNYSYFAPKQP